MGIGARAAQRAGQAFGFDGFKFCVVRRERAVKHSLRNLWVDEQGQDIAEYSVMLAVILVIVVGTVRLIGSNASNVFSQVGSAIQ